LDHEARSKGRSLISRIRFPDIGKTHLLGRGAGPHRSGAVVGYAITKEYEIKTSRH